MGHKHQHWVPRSYLAAWCDPGTPQGQEPYVWCFDKAARRGRAKAPNNIFHETDMYTVQIDGRRDLRLENGLSTVESKFVHIRNEVLYKRRPLSEEDRIWLLIFIATAKARTRAMRDHQKEQWGRLLEKMNRMQDRIDNATPEELNRLVAHAPVASGTGETISHESVKAMAETPLQTALPIFISTQLKMLLRMKLAILYHDFKPGFITSDEPCVWFDPEAYKYPALFRSPGLGMASIEVTLPLSPRQIALVSHQELEGYIPVYKPSVVEEMNRRSRFHCDEYFVVSKNAVNPVWFEEREPPKSDTNDVNS